jgi:glycosyltransferase involved in cell wall biosynthesis
MKNPVRIAVLNSHPIQYFAPLYAYLNKDPAIDVTALYCSDFSLRGGVDLGFQKPVAWDVDLLDGYPHKFLGKKAGARTPRGFWSLICPEVWSEIRSGRYDALVLHGYQYAAYVLAFLAAKNRGLPVFMRSETHLGLNRSGWKRLVRDVVLSIAYRFVDGFLAIGSANRDYYRSLGIADHRIHLVPYAVDNDRFAAGSRMSDEQRAGIRARFGLPPDQPVVLYASKLTPRKHPDDVVRAMSILVDRGQRASLLVVGTGVLESRLRQLVSDLGLLHAAFAGFVNQSELPAVMAAADVLVLPSDNEPWGLVVNEAMCAGLPIIVSEDVGCAPDLVRDGVNGYVVAVGDVDAMASALNRALGDDARRHEMGQNSRDAISKWGFAQCRVGLLSALGSARMHR